MRARLNPHLRLVASVSLALIVSGRAQEVTEVSVIRSADYEQLAETEPQPVPQTPEQDPFYVLAVMAMSNEFLSDLDNLLFVRAVTMQPPSGQLRGLEFFDGFGGFYYYQAFTTGFALENAFRTGTYRFTFGSLITGDAVYDLVVPDRTLLAPAWVQNFAAAQRVDPARDFSLHWTPAPANGGVRLEIVETGSGIQVYDSGPQLGAHTSLVIPAGTLQIGPEYRAEITFTRVDVVDQSGLPYRTAASAVTTRVPIKTGTGGGTEPSRFTSITVNDAGDLVFVIECTPEVPLNLQEVAELNGVWETVQTVTPSASPVTLSVQATSVGPAAFFRVVQ